MRGRAVALYSSAEQREPAEDGIERIERAGAGDVLGVLQADVRPTRMRCVTLPISVLAKALA